MVWLPSPFQEAIIGPPVLMAVEITVNVRTRTRRVEWLALVPHPSSVEYIALSGQPSQCRCIAGTGTIIIIIIVVVIITIIIIIAC